MSDGGGGTAATRRYERVRADHRDESDPFGALRDCEDLIAAHPGSPEAAASSAWRQRLLALRVRMADGSLVSVGELLPGGRNAARDALADGRPGPR